MQRLRQPKREAAQVAAFLRRVAVVVVPADMPSDTCSDPKDIAVLVTAVGGECALLVSVDRDLLDMQRINEIGATDQIDPLAGGSDYFAEVELK